MDLVHQVDLAVLLAEFIFGVHQYESAFGGQLLPALEERQRVFFELGVVFGRYQAAGDDFVTADVLVVSFACLGGRGDDRVGELLVFLHSFRQRFAAEGPLAGLVFPPGVACQIAADHHLYLERLAEDADRGHRVDFPDFPVRHDVGRLVEEARGDLVEHLAFAGDALGKHDVEGGDTVGGYQDDVFSVDEINVPDLADVAAGLSREMEIGVGDGFHFIFRYSFS